MVDIGVVIDGQEVDCGDTRPFAQGLKALPDTARSILQMVKSYVVKHSDVVSPAELYRLMVNWAEERNFQFLGPTAGHRIGSFPTPKSETKIRPNDPAIYWAPGAWMIDFFIGDGTFGALYADMILVAGNPSASLAVTRS